MGAAPRSDKVNYGTEVAGGGGGHVLVLGFCTYGANGEGRTVTICNGIKMSASHLDKLEPTIFVGATRAMLQGGTGGRGGFKMENACVLIKRDVAPTLG